MKTVTLKKAKQVAKVLGLKVYTYEQYNEVLNGYGGVKVKEGDFLLFDDGKLSIRQTCFNCGDAHSTTLNELVGE